MGNSLSADSWMDRDACSGRNLTWQYVHNGHLPAPYAACPHAGAILAAHACRDGTCAPSRVDHEFERYMWNDWDGLGKPGGKPIGHGGKLVLLMGKYGWHEKPYGIDDVRVKRDERLVKRENETLLGLASGPVMERALEGRVGVGGGRGMSDLGAHLFACASFLVLFAAGLSVLARRRARARRVVDVEVSVEELKYEQGQEQEQEKADSEESRSRAEPLRIC